MIVEQLYNTGNLNPSSKNTLLEKELDIAQTQLKERHKENLVVDF